MFKDRVSLAKEVRDVKVARWEEFRRLAKRLPNHHVLGVELIRTRHDETAAVFTVVRNREPVQMIVMGDARGRVKADDCGPRKWMLEAQHAEGHAEPRMMEARMEASAGEGLAEETGDAAPDGFAFGGPPPKQAPEPGIIAVGSVLLASTFDVAEQIPGDDSNQ